MEVTAKLNHLRIAPRKVRLVTDLIRGRSVEEAQTILTFTIKKAAPSLLKLLKSAIANAKENFHLEEKNLYISKIFVNEGQKLKRWRPVSRGSAHPIMKRTSNVTIILDQLEEKVPTKKKIPKEKKKTTRAKKISIKKQKFAKVPEVKKLKDEKRIKKIFKRKAF